MAGEEMLLRLERIVLGLRGGGAGGVKSATWRPTGHLRLPEAAAHGCGRAGADQAAMHERPRGQQGPPGQPFTWGSSTRWRTSWRPRRQDHPYVPPERVREVIAGAPHRDAPARSREKAPPCARPSRAGGPPLPHPVDRVLPLLGAQGAGPGLLASTLIPGPGGEPAGHSGMECPAAFPSRRYPVSGAPTKRGAMAFVPSCFGKKLGRGKTKKLYRHPGEGQTSSNVHKDGNTAVMGAPPRLPARGRWRCRTTSKCFYRLEDEGEDNPLCRMVGDKSTTSPKCDMIPPSGGHAAHRYRLLPAPQPEVEGARASSRSCGVLSQGRRPPRSLSPRRRS